MKSNAEFFLLLSVLLGFPLWEMGRAFGLLCCTYLLSTIGLVHAGFTSTRKGVHGGRTVSQASQAVMLVH